MNKLSHGRVDEASSSTGLWGETQHPESKTVKILEMGQVGGSPQSQAGGSRRSQAGEAVHGPRREAVHGPRREAVCSPKQALLPG